IEILQELTESTIRPKLLRTAAPLTSEMSIGKICQQLAPVEWIAVVKAEGFKRFFQRLIEIIKSKRVMRRERSLWNVIPISFSKFSRCLVSGSEERSVVHETQSMRQRIGLHLNMFEQTLSGKILLSWHAIDPT